MKITKPINYKQVTWQTIRPMLASLTSADLQMLAKEVGIDPASDNLMEELLERGGFLVVHFGLDKRPDIMEGTYFNHDIYEYYLDGDAAQQLARGEDVTVRFGNGDFAEILPASQVVADLRSSDIFDQLEAPRD